MKHFLKIMYYLSIAFSFSIISLQAESNSKAKVNANAKPIYSTKAIFLDNSQEDLSTNLTIKTTLGPIKITKFEGALSSTEGDIISARDITVAEALASISAPKGSITAKNNIVLGADECSLTSKTALKTATGSLTIDGSDCAINVTKGDINAKNNITITTAGANSSIKASGNITCSLTISTSASGSSIVSGKNITAGSGVGSGNKLIAWGRGSSITAKGVIIADVVEANKIVCNTLVTHTKNRSADGSIRTLRNNAGGTITADTIIASVISAGTITTTKPAQTVSDGALALALSPVLNTIF